MALRPPSLAFPPWLPRVLALLGLIAAAPARAQTATPPAPTAAAPAAVAAAPPDGAEDLDALVLRARAALEARDFALAATLLEGAIGRRRAPELLFYLGEAYRELPGGTGRALRAYRRYLAEEGQPDPELRERATAAIAQLSARQVEERSQPGGSPAVRGVSPLPEAIPGAAPAPGQVLSMTPIAPVPRPAPPRTGSRARRGGLALLGVSVVLGAVGGILLSQSVSQAGAAREAESYLAFLEGNGRARQLLGAGATCLAVGGAAALSGGALLLFHALGSRAEERLGAEPLPGMPGLALGWRP